MVQQSFWNESDFWVGDIPLNYIDDTGCRWLVEDVDGWWELPPPAIPEDSRPYSDDGDYYVSGRYDSRAITVKGRILPPPNQSTLVVTDARDRLNSQLNSVRRPFIFKVDEPRYSKQAVVQISGKPTTTIDNKRNQVEFTIPLKASDPRKYFATLQNVATTLAGPSVGGRQYPRDFYYNYGEVSSDGTIYADNYGDYHTYGIIRISGPITNPIIRHVESNRSMKFNIVLGKGEFLDVNLRTRTVKLNGTQFKRTALSTDSAWFTLLAGMNSIKFTGTQHIPAVEGKERAINLAINPSWEVSTANSSNAVRENLVTKPRATSTDLLVPSAENVIVNSPSLVSDAPTDVGTDSTSLTISGLDDQAGVLSFDSGLPISPQKVYMYSLYVKSSELVNVRSFIHWQSGPTISAGGTVQLQPGVWTRLYASGRAPGYASTADVGVEIIGGQQSFNNSTLRVTGALLENSSTLNPYFDGGIPVSGFTSRWRGEEFKSASYIYANDFINSTYGSSTTPFNAITWSQARNTVDDTNNAGNVIGVKSDTPTSDDNISFVVPSSQPSSDSIIDLYSQGLYPGTKYTAMVEAIVPKTFKGSFNTVENVNYAVNPQPLPSSFSTFWKAVGSVPAIKQVEAAPHDTFVRFEIDNETTKMLGTGIEYSQNKEDIPSGSAISMVALVRSNKAVPVQPLIRWYNGSSLVRETYGTVSSTNTLGQWTSVRVDATSPLNFTRFTVSFTVADVPQSSTWSLYDYFDASKIIIQPTEQESVFFDGSTQHTDLESYAWSGEVGLSKSLKTEREGGVESLHRFARSLVFFTMSGNNINEIDEDTIVFDQAPNAPGEYQLKISFTTPDADDGSPMFISLWNGSPASTDTIYFDNFLIVEGDYTGKYFDGSAAYSDTVWNGAPNLSTSTQSKVEEVPKAEALLQYRSAWIR